MPAIPRSKKMISFEPYIRSNYTSACEKLRKLVFVKDEDMKAMLIRGDQDIALVKTWMGGYNLLRGISTEDRDKIAKRFLSFSTSAQSTKTVIDRNIIREILRALRGAFYPGQTTMDIGNV